MKDVIKPTSKAEKEGEDVEYTLEDKDYLLITAIRNLTNEIQKMRLNK